MLDSNKGYNGHGTIQTIKHNGKRIVAMTCFNPTNRCYLNAIRKGVKHTETCIYLEDNICNNDQMCSRNNLNYIFIADKGRLKLFEHEFRFIAKEAEEKLKIADRFVSFSYRGIKQLKNKTTEELKVKTFKEITDNLISSIIYYERSINDPNIISDIRLDVIYSTIGFTKESIDLGYNIEEIKRYVTERLDTKTLSKAISEETEKVKEAE